VVWCWTALCFSSLPALRVVNEKRRLTGVDSSLLNEVWGTLEVSRVKFIAPLFLNSTLIRGYC